MRTNEAIKRYFAQEKDKRAYFKEKNRFYYQYLDALVDFIVPQGKRRVIIDDPLTDISGIAVADYVILRDVLGYVYDVEETLIEAKKRIAPNGRLVITQYSALWEPVLRLASLLHLRSPSIEQNWLSPLDLRNFLELAGFEVVQSGAKMLLPKYVPLLSAFCNTFLANLWPLSRLGLIHYSIARPTPSHGSAHPSLSIIVPARNEAGTIERIVKELPTCGAFTELIFIEGHSSDHTLSEIERVVKHYRGDKRLSFSVQEGKGKGDAVRRGFDMAKGEILAIYDADMTVPPTEVERFYRAIALGKAEFINGSRLVYPVEKGAMRVLNLIANKFFSLVFSFLIGQPIKDTLCGTKVLWKHDYEDIKRNRAFFGDFDPFGDFDLLFGAVKLNRKVIDLPVHYQARVYGETNISRWKHGWLLLRMTLFAAKKLKFR